MFKDYTLMLEAFTVSEQTDFDDPMVIEVEAVLYHIFKREQEENPYMEMGVPYIVKICVGKLVRQKMIRADYIG